MATLTTIQVPAAPIVTSRRSASWPDTARLSAFDMSLMSDAGAMAADRAACVISDAAANGLAIHGANGHKPFTRRPEEPPF